MLSNATFAGGCFWGIESAFLHRFPQISTAVGYCGGKLPHPTYEQVCQGDSGHAECVQITYSESQVAYSELLSLFWSIHDPTSYHRQGLDIGSQYRSVIFYHAEEQRRLAKESKEKEQLNHKNPIVTSIEPMSVFYLAEDYHQKYHLKHGGGGSCRIP